MYHAAVDKKPAYGWKNVIAKRTANALKNAENYGASTIYFPNCNH